MHRSINFFTKRVTANNHCLIERLSLSTGQFATMISMIMVLNQKGDIMISRQYRCVCPNEID